MNVWMRMFREQCRRKDPHCARDSGACTHGKTFIVTYQSALSLGASFTCRAVPAWRGRAAGAPGGRCAGGAGAARRLRPHAPRA